jgi:Tol biopolymer transport system component
MRLRPRSLAAAARSLFLSGITLLILMGGCTKKKIDSVQPDLLVTIRLSLSSSGGQGNLDAVNDPPGISNNGQFVAFTSKAFNLVPNDNNNAPDVFYRDNIARTTTLVSMNLSGTGSGNGPSGSPWLSGNGQYVVFASKATNLTSDILPLGNPQQIYVRDMFTGTTTLVSRANGLGGPIADLDCNNPKISNDGTAIIFDSATTVLDITDVTVSTVTHVYRRLWLNGNLGYPTELVDFASGTTTLAGPAFVANGNSVKGAPSADGRFIAFESNGSTLVSAPADGGPDKNGTTDVFVRDMMTFRTVRCSVPGPGFTEVPPAVVGPSQSATISADGQTVGFRSTSPILSAIAQETNPNIYARAWNAASPFTEVLSVHTSGATGGASCDHPTMSADGARVVWDSISASLVNGDTNGVPDVFQRDRSARITSRESVSTFGNQLNAPSERPSISADGRYIAFYSEASNVVDDQSSGASDIFLRGPPFR